MNSRINQANRIQQLEDQLTRLTAECKLDSWTAFVDEMKVPNDIYVALATGRPELIKAIGPRDLKAEEAEALFSIISSLLKTNMALREHAEQLACFTDQWIQAFKALFSVGRRINRFAYFDKAETDDEESYHSIEQALKEVKK